MRDTIVNGTPDLREVTLPDGRSFALSLYPVSGRDGITDRVVVYLRETTMEKRMRMQVWQSERMATVGKLTAGLAHEINNPLTVIRGLAQSMRSSIDRDAFDLKTADSSLDRMVRMTKRIDRNATGKIEIFLAVRRDQPSALAPLESEIDPRIGWQ